MSKYTRLADHGTEKRRSMGETGIGGPGVIRLIVLPAKLPSR